MRGTFRGIRGICGLDGRLTPTAGHSSRRRRPVYNDVVVNARINPTGNPVWVCKVIAHANEVNLVFSSPTFLFLFLPLTLLVYHVIPERSRIRNWWLLAASIGFYFWGAGSAILAIVFVGVSSFVGAYVGWRVAQRRAQAPTVAQADQNSGVRTRAGTRIPTMVILLVVAAPLIAFKYLPQISTYHLPILGPVLDQLAAAHWVMPLGISFFTFHAISFVVDSARTGAPLTKSFSSYLLYLFVFPHQIAGPIVRYSEIGRQIEAVRVISARQLGYGVTRFTWGLAKKVLIADACGRVADSFFNHLDQTAQLSAPGAWIGVLAYTLQIYFDFSGYSDMAIGLALMFGFTFPENFRAPYTASSVTDFWRRWHITLTKWFRDYVYIPLGGNRKGVWVEYGALLLVFFLTSLWHGALIGFLVWGALHSGALLFERVTGLRNVKRFVLIRRAITFAFVLVSWVPFRVTTGHNSLLAWRTMFTGTWDFISPHIVLALTPTAIIALAVGSVVAFMPSKKTGFQTVFGGEGAAALFTFRWKCAWVLAPIMLFVTLAIVLWSDFSPFLYFQF